VRLEFAASAAVLLILSGCASTDPWERMNRKTFAFNEAVDQYALEPVAKGWRVVTPQILRTGLRNFFDHLGMPVVLLNDVLQLKPIAVADDLTRIVTNTVFGLGGFIDVASREKVPKHDEDFGQTLGVWGTPSGPYFVIPFLGPSTPRDAFGLLVDTFSAPQSYFIPFWASASAFGVRIVNLRSEYIEEIDQNRGESLDYYVFLRSAYLQNRRKKVEDAVDPPEEAEEDLYYFDDEDFEGDDDGS
jgi:phospholipid-binding lipoprotein MlaA